MNWHETVGGVAYTSYYSLRPEKLPSSFVKKKYKKLSEDYIQTICISSDHNLNTCKISKESAYTVGGVAYTRYLVSACIYFGLKND